MNLMGGIVFWENFHLKKIIVKSTDEVGSLVVTNTIEYKGPILSNINVDRIFNCIFPEMYFSVS